MFHSSWIALQRVADQRLNNVDFKNPKEQKSFDDTLGDLAGISVKGMFLITVFCSIFLEKKLWIYVCLFCIDVVQRIDGIAGLMLWL